MVCEFKGRFQSDDNEVIESVTRILSGTSDSKDYNGVSAFYVMENEDLQTDRDLYTNLKMNEMIDNPIAIVNFLFKKLGC